MEIFKEIEGYEGLYQVSNLGNVKSLKYGKEKILKPQKNRYGYLYVNLCKQGKRKIYTIHRLVAQSFIPNPNNYPQVNHKDENKTNNYIENLEWCTNEYNSNYGTAIQRRVENTDYKAIVSKKDYKAIVSKKDYKAIAAKIDYKARTAKIDYKAIAAKRSKQVLCVETGKIYPSIIEVQRQLGFAQTHISSACRGKLKTAYKYHWEYVS